MGCFGYICKGCKTSIRGNCFTGGEKAVLIHVRHGEELGRVEGHYDEYGRVIEQKDFSEDERFRGNNDLINGHSEICESELRMSDSYIKVIKKREYNGRHLDFYGYAGVIIGAEMNKNLDDVRKSNLYIYLEEEYKSDIEKAYLEKKPHIALAHFSLGLDRVKYMPPHFMVEDFIKLPPVKMDKYSGIVAWHSLCYSKASDMDKNDLTPSEHDPNQSWGKVRKKYM